MNWTNLIWLGLGFGFGLVSRELWRRPPRKPHPMIEQLPETTHTQLPDKNANPIPNSLDRQQLDDHRQQLDDQLNQLKVAYQMATEMSQFKGGFLARASHELRSPLNGLIGMHQLILSDLCDSPEEEREFITQANESARKMVNVLDRILDVARVQHGTVEMDIRPIQLAQILQEVQDLTHLQARNRNLQLQVLLPEPEIYVLADPLRFRQILIHLVDVAISRMPESGIMVSTYPSSRMGYVDIWIDDHCPVSDRNEPINFLSSDLPTDSTLLSPGLNLLLAQILLQLMQGHLEAVPISPASKAASSENPLTRLQCSIPTAQK